MIAHGPWRWALSALILATGALACDEEHPCLDFDYGSVYGETLQLKVSGTCVGTPREVDLAVAGCRLNIKTAPGPAGIPLHGAADQAGHSVREGGWQLFGPVCPDPQAPCTMPTEFRRCLARRVEWRIDLDCFDAQGAPVCQAVLTE